MKRVFPDDSLLTEQISAGDVDAFTVLYERYHGYLYHFSLKFLKSRELSEEVVHDVFLSIWENRKLLDPARSLKGYLIKSCKNQVLNLMTRSLREQTWKKEVMAGPEPMHSDTEGAILIADYERLAEEAISRLPPRRQKIFRMYRIEDRSLDEIATALHISKGTVKDHLLKATRQLRSFIHLHSGISDIVLLILLCSHP